MYLNNYVMKNIFDWLIIIQLALRMNFIHAAILQQDKTLFSKSVGTSVQLYKFVDLIKVVEKDLQVLFIEYRNLEDLYLLKLIG